MLVDFIVSEVADERLVGTPAISRRWCRGIVCDHNEQSQPPFWLTFD